MAFSIMISEDRLASGAGGDPLMACRSAFSRSSVMALTNMQSRSHCWSPSVSTRITRAKTLQQERKSGSGRDRDRLVCGSNRRWSTIATLSAEISRTVAGHMMSLPPRAARGWQPDAQTLVRVVMDVARFLDHPTGGWEARRLIQHMLRSVAETCPHTPIGRFLRVGIA